MLIQNFKAKLIEIGNSVGIIVPSTIVKQNDLLRDKEYLFTISNGLDTSKEVGDCSCNKQKED